MVAPMQSGEQEEFNRLIEKLKAEKRYIFHALKEAALGMKLTCSFRGTYSQATLEEPDSIGEFRL